MSSELGRVMTSVYAVVDGKSEQAFAQQVVAEHLAARGVFLEAALVGKPGRKGGARTWASARGDLVRFLKMSRSGRPVHVTTMFDYYGMPPGWPGRKETASLPFVHKAARIEKAMADDIRRCMGAEFDASRFVPYVQMHELEALILADPSKLGDEFPEQRQKVEALAQSIGNADPESVNDGQTTAPSKRIIAFIPEYRRRKASAAANVLKLIGLHALRAKCAHFDDWMNRLEELGNPS